MYLFIAEKPDLGKAIAAAIPGTSDFSEMKSKAIIKKTFHDEPAIICWCFGHLLELKDPEDYDEKYGSWNIEDLPIYFENWEYRVRKEKKDSLTEGKKGLMDVSDRVAQIGSYLKNMGPNDTVVHAGDIDDEGQLLIDEILRWHNYHGKVLRLNTNDLAPRALYKSLENMEPNDDFVQNGISAFGRMLCDKVFGYNLSRYYTILNQSGSGKGRVLPVGRVKMPTLGLVVRRDLLIESHQKMLYYTLKTDLDIDGTTVHAHFEPAKDDPHLSDDGKIIEKSYIDEIEQSVKSTPIQPCTVTKEKRQEGPPLPFNETKLFLYCSRRWGLNPSTVAKVTQSLREKYKAITYNRSDCQYLGTETHKEAPKTLPLVCKNLGMTEQQADKFDASIKSKCFNDKKLEGRAHTAIIPTQTEQNLSEFTENEAKVYTAIALYYLIQFLPNCEKEITKLVSPSVNGGRIVATESKIVVPGWRALLSKDEPSTENEEPDESKKEEAPAGVAALAPGTYNGKIAGTKVMSQETKPPSRYTEATLVDDMTRISKYCENEKVKQLLLKKDEGKEEEHGSIGTSATRNIIVSELVKIGYLRTEKKGKQEYLISTPVGRDFYNILPDSVRKVDVSAKWWYEQELIKDGKMTPDQMAKDVLRTINAILQSGEGRMEKADEYAQGFTSLEPVATCPKCGGQVMETAKGFRCAGKPGTPCKFYIPKNDKFISAFYSKPLTGKAIKIMTTDKRIRIKNCKSKAGKIYDAVILCDFSGDFPKYSLAGDEELPEVAKCPKCGGKIVEKNKGFSCSEEGCSFMLWKKDKFLEAIGKKELSVTDAKNILDKGKTSVKLKSSAGKPYTKDLLIHFEEDKCHYKWELANSSGLQKRSSGSGSKGGVSGLKVDFSDFGF